MGSDARLTVESQLLSGLSKSAHITGASAKYSDIQVADLMEALFFNPSGRWAVTEYLRELTEESTAATRQGE